MNHYELTYIIPMSFTVDEVPKINENVSGILKEHGAKIAKETSMGKLKFAYPINDLSHGYYQVVEFDVEPSQILEINKTLGLHHEIVRYLLVTKRIKTEEELAADQRLRDKIAKQELERRSTMDEDESVEEKPKRSFSKAKPSVAKHEEEKVSIEDLDKKLDAILEGEDMLK